MQVLDDTLGLEEERDMIDGGDIVHANNLIFANMTKHRNFGLRLRLERAWYDEPAGDLLTHC